MTLAGMKMRVVGRDATPMRGRDGTDTSYETDTITIGPGESYDVHLHGAGVQRRSRSSGTDTTSTCSTTATTLRSNNLAPGGFGGQATEIHVYPGGRRRPAVPERLGDLTVMTRASRPSPEEFHRRTLRGRALVISAIVVTATVAPVGGAHQPTAAATPPRVGIACTQQREPGPHLHPDHEDRLHHAAGRRTHVHVGLLERLRPFQHPGPVLCVNEGDTVRSSCTTPSLKRSRSSSRARRTCWPTACRPSPSSTAVAPHLADEHRRGRTAAASPTASWPATPGPIIYESGTNPPSRCAWACSAP